MACTTWQSIIVATQRTACVTASMSIVKLDIENIYSTVFRGWCKANYVHYMYN